MKKILTTSTILIVLLCCNNNNVSFKNDIELDKNMLYLKNHIFLEYLSKLKNQSEIVYKIEKNDSCYQKNHIYDVTIHQYIQTYQYELNYIYFDNNSKKLIDKWLEKEFDLIPLEDGEKIKHSYDYYKALEFYNSEDLKKYIDSVRSVEMKKMGN